MLIPDNSKAIVQIADPLAPRLTAAFLEYAQARSFVVLLPWTWMRHVYALLGLCRRFGDARVEKICAIALADGPGRWPLTSCVDRCTRSW